MDEVDYVLITALFAIVMMALIRELNDGIFIYYQHVALPLMLPIP